MIGLSGFGFGRKPRQFEYKPRHYDPDAEEKEARRRAILGDDYKEGQKEYIPGMMIRESRYRRMQTANNIQKKSKTTIIRVFIFLILLVVVFFFLADGIAALMTK